MRRVGPAQSPIPGARTFSEFAIATVDVIAAKFRQVFLTPLPNSGPVPYVIPPLPVYSQDISAQPAWDERLNYTGACDPVTVPPYGVNDVITEIPTVYQDSLNDPNYM